MLRTAILLLTAFHFSLFGIAAFQEKKEPAKKDPKILYSIPLVARPGEKQKLALRGTGLVGVKEIKVLGAEGAKATVLSGKAAAAPNNYPAERIGDSEVELELTLPKKVKPGEVKLVAVGGGGESTPYPLLLRDDLPAIIEKEPNEGFEQAQAIKTPCAVEGVIKSEKDVDVFKFEGKKGDKLKVEIQARRYGSPLDPILTVYDSCYAILESADDTSGKPDSIINITLPRDGTYYVSVIDASDLGGAGFGYRLILRTVK